MDQSDCSAQLHAILGAVYHSANRSIPQSFLSGLVEIADERSAIEFFELVQGLASRKAGDDERVRLATIVDCVDAVLDALQTFRNFRDWTARPSPDRIERLRRCDGKHLVPTLEKSIQDPEHCREILTFLLRGARAINCVEEGNDERGWKIRIVLKGTPGAWTREEVDWAMSFAEHPDLFQQAIVAGRSDLVGSMLNAKRVRRLLTLVKMPTAKKFRKILADEQDGDIYGTETVLSAFRHAAKQSVYKERQLPTNWVDEISADCEQISIIAREAHRLMRRGLNRQGRPRRCHHIEGYAAHIAEAYESLAGKPISYARATGNAQEHEAGSNFGQGLRFMVLALRLIDGAVSDNQARALIDKINGWGARK